MKTVLKVYDFYLNLVPNSHKIDYNCGFSTVDCGAQSMILEIDRSLDLFRFIGKIRFVQTTVNFTSYLCFILLISII